MTISIEIPATDEGWDAYLTTYLLVCTIPTYGIVYPTILISIICLARSTTDSSEARWKSSRVVRRRRVVESQKGS